MLINMFWPEDTHGYDLSDYIIGVVTKNNCSNPVVKWLLDGDLYQFGRTCLLLTWWELDCTMPMFTIMMNNIAQMQFALCRIEACLEWDMLSTLVISLEIQDMMKTMQPIERNTQGNWQRPYTCIIYRLPYRGRSNFSEKATGSVVAIKTMSLNKKGKQTQLNMFKGEIEMLSR